LDRSLDKGYSFIKKLFAAVFAVALLYVGILVYQDSSAPTSDEDPYVNVYNWYGMIPADVLAEFEAETGLTVRYDLYDNNEMVEAKLFSGNTGYDVIFPSASPYIHRHIKAGVYQPIQKDLLPNLVYLDPVIADKMRSVDPELIFSIPYYWGTFGFAYVEEEIKKFFPDAPTESYAMLFDPEVVSKFAEGGVTLLDEAVDIYPAVLAYLGLNPQSSDPKELKKAQEELLKVRPFIKRFSSSRFVNELAGGESCIAQAWSGEAQLAQDRADELGKNITIRYVVPKEGGTIWIDAMVIPKGAPHPKNAHKFINFLLRPDISARIVNDIKVAIANTDAINDVDEPIREDKTIYPPAELLEKLMLDRAQNNKYERIRTRLWTKFRLGSAEK
jgi:putrescine transport system substrate-binding protein